MPSADRSRRHLVLGGPGYPHCALGGVGSTGSDGPQMTVLLPAESLYTITMNVVPLDTKGPVTVLVTDG